MLSRSIHWAHVSRAPAATRPIHWSGEYREPTARVLIHWAHVSRGEAAVRHWAHVSGECPADTPIPTSASCRPNETEFKSSCCQATSPSSKPLPVTTGAPFQKWALSSVRRRWSFHISESNLRRPLSSTTHTQIQWKQLLCISTSLSREHADSRRHLSLSG